MVNLGVRGAVLAVSLIAAPLVGEAQRAEIPKVGVITPSSRDSATSRGFREAFERGLQDLGWNPGRNLVIEYRFAEGSDERLFAFAVELARLPVDIFVTRGMAATRAARRTTTTIPIVMSAAGGDPVQGGFVSSLARPGGNITGLTLVVQELDGKRLQLIKETIPRLNRVAFLANPTSPTYDLSIKDITAAAQSLGIPLSTIEARERAFAAMAQARVDSLVVQADAVLFERHQPQIIALAARHRLPVMYPWREYTDQGGLMSYSASLTGRSLSCSQLREPNP